jgi:type VI protein secretion system component Hcp
MFTVALWAGLLVYQPALAGLIVHLKIDGVPGDSTAMTGWHPVDTWQNSQGWTPGGTRATFEPLRVLKPVGSRSSVFGVLVGTGQVIKEVTIDVRRSENLSVPFYSIVLRDAVVRSYSVSGSQAGFMEELTFAYGRIEWTFYPVTSTGTVGTPVTGRWDVGKNTFYQ